MEKTFELFFISGLPKSGTSWCSNFLNSLQGIKVLGEGRFFAGKLKNLQTLYEQLEKAVDGWVEFVGRRKGNWLLNDQYIVTINKTNYIPSDILEKEKKEISCLLIKHLIYNLASRASEFYGVHKVGDKTPIFSPSEIKNWISCFNKERFIILTRDFIDWVVSLSLHFYHSNLTNRPDRHNIWLSDEDLIFIHKFKEGKEKSILKKERVWILAEFYKEMVETFEFLFNANKDRILLIKYEDLFNYPEEHFRAVCDFLGIDVSEAELNKAIDEVSIQKVKKSDGYMNEHIRVAYPGKGYEFFSYEVNEILEWIKTGSGLKKE